MNTGIISNDSMATTKSPIVPSVIVASYATILAIATVVLDGGYVLNSISLMASSISILIAGTEVVSDRLLKR